MKKVAVLLTNRFAKFSQPYPRDDLTPYYSFRPPNYKYIPAYRDGFWDGRISLLKRQKVPTGLFLATRRQIEEELGLKFDVKRDFVEIKFRQEGVTSDREYQNECVEQMVAAAKNDGGGLVLAATRTGKTFMVASLFSRLVGAGCFIVDELTLLKQAQKELSERMGERVGHVGKGEFNPRRITVATSQTLHLHQDDPKFEQWIDSLQVNVIDEIHVAMNRRNFDIVEAIAPPAVFGLTATLELQKKHVRVKAYALTGPVCYEYPLTQGQAEGHLVPGVVVQILKPGPDDSGYGSRQYAQMYSDLIVTNANRNNLLCDLARLAVTYGRFPIILVERIRHLKILSRMLRNVPHRVVCGVKRVEERLAAIRNFEAGKVKLLIVNKVFQKGVTIPKLDVTIDGGAMKGRNRCVQIFGRGVGLAKGKLGLIHFDLGDIGNHFSKASKSRRLAFKKKSIPLKKFEWDESSDDEAARAFNTGLHLLEKEIKKRAVSNGQLDLFSSSK